MCIRDRVPHWFKASDKNKQEILRAVRAVISVSFPALSHLEPTALFAPISVGPRGAEKRPDLPAGAGIPAGVPAASAFPRAGIPGDFRHADEAADSMSGPAAERVSAGGRGGLRTPRGDSRGDGCCGRPAAAGERRAGATDRADQPAAAETHRGDEDGRRGLCGGGAASRPVLCTSEGEEGGEKDFRGRRTCGEEKQTVICHLGCLLGESGLIRGGREGRIGLP